MLFVIEEDTREAVILSCIECDREVTFAPAIPAGVDYSGEEWYDVAIRPAVAWAQEVHRCNEAGGMVLAGISGKVGRQEDGRW